MRILGGTVMLRTVFALCLLFLCAHCGRETSNSAPSSSPASPLLGTFTPDGAWRGGLVGLWEPPAPAKGVLLLHQGHSPWDGGAYPPGDLTPAAEAFRAAGYWVFGLEMPPMPHQGIPFEGFLEASSEVLDMVDIHFPDLPVFMVGLSGGGWTTTMLTAHDGRIVRGYSVAGDHPVISMNPDLPDCWEECLGDGAWIPWLGDYEEVYARAGDRLVHIYNWYEPTVFGEIDDRPGAIIDYTEAAHAISPWAVAWILDDIRAMLP